MPLCAFVELEGGRSAWTDGRSAAQRCCLVLRAAPWKGSAFRAGTCSLPRPSLPTGKTQGTVLAEFLRQAGPASPRVVCAVVPLCPVALDCASSRKEVGKEGRPLSVTHAPAPEVGLLSQPPWGALGSRGGALMCGRICVCVCVCGPLLQTLQSASVPALPPAPGGCSRRFLASLASSIKDENGVLGGSKQGGGSESIWISPPMSLVLLTPS